MQVDSKELIRSVMAVVTFFGNAFEADMSIVHSTSWRYNYELDQLILTYLVVLPYRGWMEQWAAAGCISIKGIGAIEKVQGSNLLPPDRIERDGVLAHALDHLALLSRNDRSIEAVLQPEWIKVLQMRLPKPAGLVQFVPNSPLQFPGFPSTKPTYNTAPYEIRAC